MPSPPSSSGGPAGQPTWPTDLSYELQFDAYVLSVEAVEAPSGEWVYRAAYEQLPDVVEIAPSALVAVAGVEHKRDAYLRRVTSEGRTPPGGWPRRHASPGGGS